MLGVSMCVVGVLCGWFRGMGVFIGECVGPPGCVCVCLNLIGNFLFFYLFIKQSPTNTILSKFLIGIKYLIRGCHLFQCYSSLLQSKAKGRAYILNVMFRNNAEYYRKGSDMDCKNMVHLFEEIGYDVSNVHQDDDLSAKV